MNFPPAVVFLTVAVAHAGSFQQEVAHTYTTQDGLPSNAVVSIAVVNGRVFAKTSDGVARFFEGRWSRDTAQFPVRSNIELTDSRGRAWSVRAGAVIAPYTPADGLPYDKITSIAAGEDGVIWLATRRGAIRFDGKNWEYRQGLRWLPDDDVRAIAVEANGNAWFATKKGVGAASHHAGRESQVLRG
ncbi:MAG: two-component regulator propeller domain-containing protein [Bryobacteraceae bacterium]